MQHVLLPAGQQLMSASGFGHYAAVPSQALAEVFGAGPGHIQDGERIYMYGASGWVEPATAASPRSVTMDQHEVLVSVQASAARLVRISAQVELTVTAGQTAPRLDVDVGDDGIVDASTSLPSMMANPILATTTAIPIRLTVAGGLQVNDGSAASFQVRVTLRVAPINDITIARSGTGCTPQLDFRVNEAFGSSGVRLGLANALNPHVVVLGLGLQPTLLAPVPIAATCFLFPTPDVLLLGQLDGIDLPIPAAVRPFSFQAQAVALSGLGPLLLMVPDSYSVYAY